MNFLELPWPPPVLFPNKSMRTHWAKRSKAAKLAREAAFFLATANHLAKPTGEMVNIRVVFEQPDRRKRDWDGMIGSVKAYLDGLSDYLGIDDSKFRLSFEFPAEPRKPGFVTMEISNASTQ